MKTNGGSDETLLVQFERDISNVPLLGLVEGVTGISRSTIMFGVGFIAFICVLLGLLDNLLTNLIGFAYPAYASFKAIESTDLNGNTQWLTYWVVFASFTMVEYFSCTLLYYFPLYYPTKMLFLLWCFLPQTQGAAWVYRTIVRPFLMTHESKIDASLQKAIDHIKVKLLHDNSNHTCSRLRYLHFGLHRKLSREKPCRRLPGVYKNS